MARRPDAERARLADDRRGLEALGPVPGRARLGHRARGLQRGRRRVGLLPARPRPLAAPTAGARTASAGSATTTSALCLALALWNGRDPILKERIFGLTGTEGNHGEDAKEYWWYLDSTPTHSWMRWRYHYPQARVPVRRPRRRERPPRPRSTRSTSCSTPASSTTTATGRSTVDYAKAAPDDVLHADDASRNAGPERGDAARAADAVVPQHVVVGPRRPAAHAQRPSGGALRRRPRRARADGASSATARPDAAVLRQRDQRRGGCGASAAARRIPKDGINDHVVHGAADRRPRRSAARRRRSGTGSTVARRRHGGDPPAPGARRPAAVGRRRGDADAARPREREADEFYAALTPSATDAPRTRMIMRQACAGMLWSKQFYHYDVGALARRRPRRPAAARRATWRPQRATGATSTTPTSSSMPDTWEYPWYAAWDLAFHCVALAHVDPEFAKDAAAAAVPRVVHAPQRPAARLRVGVRRRQPAGARVGRAAGVRDRRLAATVDFLERDLPQAAHQLHVVGQPQGRRGQQRLRGRLPRASTTSARSTAPRQLPVGRAPRAVRRHGLDGDVLPRPAGDALVLAAPRRRRTRTWRPSSSSTSPTSPTAMLRPWPVGRGGRLLLRRAARGRTGRRTAAAGPLDGRPAAAGRPPRRSAATTIAAPAGLRRAHRAGSCEHEPDRGDVLVRRAHPRRPRAAGCWPIVVAGPAATACCAACSTRPSSSRRTACARSRPRHRDEPFAVDLGGMRYAVDYEPGESTTGLFGGNSNWRGPVWFPVNYLLIEALRRFATLLRRRLTGRVPDRVGEPADPDRGRRRARRAG